MQSVNLLHGTDFSLTILGRCRDHLYSDCSTILSITASWQVFNASQQDTFILKLPCCLKKTLYSLCLPFHLPLIHPFISFVCAINYWEFSAVSTFNTVENKGQKTAPPKMSLQANEGKQNPTLGWVHRLAGWMATSGLGGGGCPLESTFLGGLESTYSQKKRV